MHRRKLLSQRNIKYRLAGNFRCIDIFFQKSETTTYSLFSGILRMIIVYGKSYTFILIIVKIIVTTWISQILSTTNLLHEVDCRIVFLGIMFAFRSCNHLTKHYPGRMQIYVKIYSA